MARRASRTDDVSDENYIPPDVEIERIIEQLDPSQDANVMVYRQGLNGRDLSFIDEMPAANFSIAMLKSPPYNGGKFRVQVHAANGDMIKNKAVVVEPPPKESTPVPAPMGDVQSIVQAITKSSEQNQLLVGKLAELIVAVNASARGATLPAKTTKDFLEEVALIKQFLPAPVLPAPQADPIKMISELLGVVRDLPTAGGEVARPAGPFDVLLRLAQDWLPKIWDAVQQKAAVTGDPNNRISQPTQPNSLPPPTPMPIDPRAELFEPHPPAVVHGPPDARAAHYESPAGAPAAMTETAETMIQRQLKFLATQAALMVDPEPYAALIINNVPEAVLRSFLDKPDWFDEICKLAPEAKPYRVWFEDLRGYIVEDLTPDPGGVETLTGAPTRQ